MSIYFCNVEEKHEGHHVLVHEKQICTGATKCGNKSHTEHEFEASVEKWCPGVCGCSLILMKHGRGEHK